MFIGVIPLYYVHPNRADYFAEKRDIHDGARRCCFLWVQVYKSMVRRSERHFLQRGR